MRTTFHDHYCINSLTCALGRISVLGRMTMEEIINGIIMVALFLLQVPVVCDNSKL